VLIAALLGLVDGGPGVLSADRALGIHDTGPAWALAALAAGAAASALVIELGRTPVAPDAASEPDPGAGDEAASRGEFAAQASR